MNIKEGLNRERFKNYSINQVAVDQRDNQDDYFYKLYFIKLNILKAYAPFKRILDIGCGCGEYLDLIHHLIQDKGVGVDFSQSAIDKAREDHKMKNIRNTEFFCNDAVGYLNVSEKFDCIYSFSALYAIDGVDRIVSAISRKLNLQGLAILDFGNKFSLNTLVSKAQKDAPLPFYISIKQMKDMLTVNNLKVLQWRSFQILPYWGKDPWWLRPLLLNFLKKIFSKEIKGKMIDEWVSSSFLFKPFAFRHIIVCQKVSQ